ncbi:MAG: undecaprenyl-phosphate glucose phosphotransferase [Myxococcales bacterium]|nr:undecaprenyl-phosphate glucose phosphotransferase [Myxococcales bacterium]
MLRKHSEVFRTLCAAADLAVIASAWACAYGLRFHTSVFPEAPATPDPFSYALLGVAMLPLWHYLLRKRRLYQPRRGDSARTESRVLLESAVIATLFIAAGTFFWKEAISRLVVLLFLPLVSAGLVVFRAALRYGLRELRRRGLNRRTVLLLGNGVLAHAIYERLADRPETGLHVIGFLASRLNRVPTQGPPVLGHYSELSRVVADHEVDQVVIALEREESTDLSKLVRELTDTTATVRIAPDLQGLPTLQPGIEDLDGIPLIRLIESPTLGWQRISKRAFDFAGSFLGLVLVAPLLAGIALAIKLSEPRSPVLYRQRRMGLDGVLFSIVKFRTMRVDAEPADEPGWTVPGDPRSTKLGALLRRFNLDEIPQLWNVFRGEMSLVGPRPERPEFIRHFRDRIPGYMLRHKVKAGMTGWAQVNGWRGDTSIEKRLEYDLEYLRRWSFGFDLWILALTPVRGFSDPNAY